MHCPFCRNTDSRVVDSRTADDGGQIRRRRQCPACNRRFTTIETASLSVLKRSGVTEPFSRSKVLVGVRKACQGRPVTEDQLAILAQRVEESIRSQGSAEIDAHEVGMAILPPLRELDEVAYLRFASVYRSFESVEDFQREMGAWVTEGDVRYHEDVTIGLDRAPEAFVGMLKGRNLGLNAVAGKPPEMFAAGRRVPVIGRVSMDMLCVDLSALPQAGIGSEIETILRDGNCVHNSSLGGAADTRDS